jgi:hypothetical protein
MRAMPSVRQALLQPGIADAEDKISATTREGVSFYPDLAKYLTNATSSNITLNATP